MTQALKRIRILQLPSPNAAKWSEAISEACSREGWQFEIHVPGETPVLDPHRSSVVLGYNDHLPEGEVTDWLVLSNGPDGVANALAAAGAALPRHEILYEASGRLAAAAVIAARGWPVFSSEAGPLIIPGLGEISILPSGQQAPQDNWLALAVFEDLPVKVGGQATFAPGDFTYPDGDRTRGDGVIPLVGRRRLLLNGPNVWLPEGRWSFSARFALDPQDHAELFVEWGFGASTASYTQMIEHPGTYEIVLEHVWPELAPADFRISMMTPALDGRLEFQGGTLLRLAD